MHILPSFLSCLLGTVWPCLLTLAVALPPRDLLFRDTLPLSNVTFLASDTYTFHSGECLVKFHNFDYPLVPYLLVGPFVAEAHRNLRNEQRSRHAGKWDGIPSKHYEFSSPSPHLSFSIIQDPAWASAGPVLAYDMVDIVLTGIGAFAEHYRRDGSGRITSADITLFWMSRGVYMSTGLGHFDGPQLRDAAPPAVTRDSSLDIVASE